MHRETVGSFMSVSCEPVSSPWANNRNKIVSGSLRDPEGPRLVKKETLCRKKISIPLGRWAHGCAIPSTHPGLHYLERGVPQSLMSRAARDGIQPVARPQLNHALSQPTYGCFLSCPRRPLARDTTTRSRPEECSRSSNLNRAFPCEFWKTCTGRGRLLLWRRS